MHKLLLFLKRKPGLSLAEFSSYYEKHHVPLVMKYMNGAERYVRRYLEPAAGMPEMDFDVITELWFKDQSKVAIIIDTLTKDAMPADVIADELNFMDRSKSRFHVVIEEETKLS